MQDIVMNIGNSVLVGDRAWDGAFPGDGPPADGEWEVWASANVPPVRGRLVPGGPLVDAVAGAGHQAFHWDGPGGPVCVRVWRPETAGAMFVRAHDGADLRFVPAPWGPVRLARPAALLLSDRAELLDPADWYPRILRFHRRRGLVADATATAEERAAHALRVAEVTARLDPVHPVSMRSPNATFFSGFRHAAIRLYEHDDLHRATCYYDVPLYHKLKDDPALAYIPRGNFERLEDSDRLRLVREECYAIALERMVVPAAAFALAVDAGDAYLYALHRVSTDLATGWFRDYAIDHFPQLATPDRDYVDRFDAARAAGGVRMKAALPIAGEVRDALGDNLRRVEARRDLAGLPGRRLDAAAAPS